MASGSSGADLLLDLRPKVRSSLPRLVVGRACGREPPFLVSSYTSFCCHECAILTGTGC